MDKSRVLYYGAVSNSCGYCKGSSDCSSSYGMSTGNVSVHDYQDLIDRGWRRCGTYCYKQDHLKTCCKSYTIKCDVDDFKLSHSHKKILKRLNKFLADGLREPDAISQKGDDVQQQMCADTEPSSAGTTTAAATAKKPIQKGTGVDVTKPPCRKAKQQRLERRNEKQSNKTGTGGPPKPINKVKTVEDLIAEMPENGKHKLEIKLVSADLKSLEPTIRATYALYQRYQADIHEDVSSYNSFINFLQKSPLRSCAFEVQPSPFSYGSFHQQYWLDGELIAVGVIDILPLCVSSVYFFYNPDYRFLTLGTYGSLREIAFTRQICHYAPAIRSYYMGFYIPTCPKMRYKSGLRPSYLLCPFSQKWHILNDEIQQKLDRADWSALIADEKADLFDVAAMNRVPIVLDGNELYLFENAKTAKKITPEREALIFEYGNNVGKKLAVSMFLFVD